MTPYERSSPAVMSIGPELGRKKIPSKSGLRPMSREGFASRILANRSGEMSATAGNTKEKGDANEFIEDDPLGRPSCDAGRRALHRLVWGGSPDL